MYPLATRPMELQRTALNAIMTAWQCGGQGFESPQLHPSEQGFLRHARFRPTPWLQFWLQFACPYLSAAGRPSGPPLRGPGRGRVEGRPRARCRSPLGRPVASRHLAEVGWSCSNRLALSPPKVSESTAPCLMEALGCQQDDALATTLSTARTGPAGAGRSRRGQRGSASRPAWRRPVGARGRPIASQPRQHARHP